MPERAIPRKTWCISALLTFGASAFADDKTTAKLD
ncbi:exported hypothetical protein [Paraburkholderia piptadeniae]|uniref:Uncharacterized protein n=1 Tax=Paraburkholderia piptadeniae TaxID=1701573 RepID=A0A1N7SSQ8_9BURK|nr:exported hypothetical protein [Paraburkholderia piptadeniae]